jgi:hypothetical protein
MAGTKNSRAVPTLALFQIVLENDKVETSLRVAGVGINLYPSRTLCYRRILCVQNGGFVIAAPARGRYGSKPTYALQIDAVSHYSPRITFDFQPGKLLELGTIVLRALPRDKSGRFIVELKPEQGLSRGVTHIHIGRVLDSCTPRVPIGTDSRCVLETIAPGTYKFGVFTKHYASITHEANIRIGETSKAELPVYARRRVELEWRFRQRGRSDPWQAGSVDLLTGDRWNPWKTWEGDDNHSVLGISLWNGRCTSLLSADCVMCRYQCWWVPMAMATFPESLDGVMPQDQSGDDHQIQEGMLFATRQTDWEAMIRIRKVCPVNTRGARPSGRTSAAASAHPAGSR